MKVPALVALLESGAITSSTRIDCPGAVVVNGRHIACEHPRRGHALSAVEALALSCNVFFARASERLPRRGVRTRAGFLRVARNCRRRGPWRLRRAASRARPCSRDACWPDGGSSSSIRPASRCARRPARWSRTPWGRRARRHGRVFTARGVDALAKTGTSVTRDGRSLGLVLAAWPAARPTRAAIVIVEGRVGPRCGRDCGRARARVSVPPSVGRATAAPPVRTPPQVAPSCRHGVPSAAAVAPGTACGRSQKATAAVTIRVGMPQPGGTYCGALAGAGRLRRAGARRRGGAPHGRRLRSRRSRLPCARSPSPTGGGTPARGSTCATRHTARCCGTRMRRRARPRTPRPGRCSRGRARRHRSSTRRRAAGGRSGRPPSGVAPPTRRICRHGAIAAAAASRSGCRDISVADLQRALAAAGYRGGGSAS